MAPAGGSEAPQGISSEIPTVNVTVLVAGLIFPLAGPGPAPGDSDWLSRYYLALLSEVSSGYDGAKVSELDSRLMVVFPSAWAALSCAVTMQKAVASDNRLQSSELAVGVRIGMSAGEAAYEDGEWFGDPVIEAAGLCAVANGAQVLVTKSVKAMAGRRYPIRFEPSGALVANDIAEPVETLALVWDSIPLSSALGTVSDVARVVGRDSQNDLLTRTYKRVAAGGGREVVLVSGEPGVGKTTVVAALARRAHQLGACVLVGHFDEELKEPYQGWAEALGHYVAHAPVDVLQANVEADGAELSVIVPELSQRVEELPTKRSADPDTLRHLVFSAVAGLLAQASMAAPVIVILEDLQWADPQSLQLLRHLAATSDSSRLLIIGTYRDEADASRPLAQLLASLHREHQVTDLSLRGLDQAGVLSFLEATLGTSLDDRAADLTLALCEETDGNPLFVSEVLRHLSETGALIREESGHLRTSVPISDIALPQSVRQVIGIRVDRLGEVAQRALSLGAVIGRDFDFDVVARASGIPEDDLLNSFDEAKAADLITELDDALGRYRFAHALIARTLVEDLDPRQQAQIHGEVAHALEAVSASELRVDVIDPATIDTMDLGARPQLGARLRQLAHHYARTESPADRPRAIAYSAKVGAAALEALSPGEARPWFEQALELFQAVDQIDRLVEVDLLIGLGTAQRQSGDQENRVTLLTAARKAEALGDPDRLATAILTSCEGALAVALGHVDSERVVCLEAALTAVGGSEGVASSGHDQGSAVMRAKLLASLSAELTFAAPLERRLALADAARGIARHLEDPGVLIDANVRMQYTLDVPERFEDRLAETSAMFSKAQELGDVSTCFWSAWLRSIAVMQAGLPDELARCIEAMESVSRMIGLPAYAEQTFISRAVVAMLHGDSDEAERHATQALDVAAGAGTA